MGKDRREQRRFRVPDVETAFDESERRQLDAIEAAVDAVLREGWRCGDILFDGGKLVGCREMGRLIREKIAG